MAGKTERATSAPPAKLVERIRRVDGNRSCFVAEPVRTGLARRRRAEQERSLSRPRPETVECAEIGLDAWGEGLGDGALLDPAGLG